MLSYEADYGIGGSSGDSGNDQQGKTDANAKEQEAHYVFHETYGRYGSGKKGSDKQRVTRYYDSSKEKPIYEGAYPGIFSGADTTFGQGSTHINIKD